MRFLIAFAILGAQHHLAAGQLLAGKTPQGQQCLGGDSCCTADNPCGLGEGDCDRDDQCSGNLTCGIDNCDRNSMPSFDSTDDCCQRPAEEFMRPGTEGSGQEECPKMCTKIYMPVCGSDGTTYNNKCELENASCQSEVEITVANEGKCCGPVCPAIFAPVCGSDGKTYGNQCELDYANCQSDVEITLAHDGRCCNAVCPSIFAPLCGSDGTTYDNQCQLDYANCKSGGNVTMVSKGACPTAPPPPPPSCGDPLCGEVCGVGEICEATDYKCIGSPCCLTHRCVEECPESCPDYDDPICGSDGKTYMCHCNLRMANCGKTDKVTKVHNGACEGWVPPVNLAMPLKKGCNGGEDCCTEDEVCGLGEGDCDTDAQCAPGLVCGKENCQGTSYDNTDDCCMLPDGGLEPPKPAKRIIFTLPGTTDDMWPTAAVMLENMVHFSGIIGANYTTGIMPSTVRLQARQMFNNMKVMMKVMGIKMPMMTMVNLYLTDLDDGLMVQKVWQEECNWKEYPALSMVQVSRLPGDAMMMVNGVAAAGAVDTKFFTLDPSTPKDPLGSPRPQRWIGGREFEVAMTSSAQAPPPVKEETRLPNDQV